MKYQYTNQLISETSPYLLQHVHNPVSWYPWGDEALEKAKKENKPLLISIGYAACHWCHVMEEESFENEEIAQIMNENFICIKVDREERPDIDNIYMSAVQLISGSGGWPLNCFALPDGRPFFGGTYFPLMQWKNLLLGINDAYQKNFAKVIETAEKVKNGVQQHEHIVKIASEKNFSFHDMQNGYKTWKRFFDEMQGGNKGAPKFPMPVNYRFLLHYYYHSKDKSVLNHVLLTLKQMAKGGIYDQLGGGFARYTVDDQWKIPHFEKMLYDNAQLISLYVEAFKITQENQFYAVITETTDFILREMLAPEKGFYSSFDADSEGEEGKFYCWSWSEINNLLGKDAELFVSCYGVEKDGNWEGKNILFQAKDNEQLAQEFSMESAEIKTRIENAKQILFNERNKRIKPGLDDKILTSWNALMISALVDAYDVTRNKKYRNAALEAATFIEEQMFIKGQLFRNFKNGKATIPAFLDDYANFIEALLKLYQLTFNEHWLNLAHQLTEIVLRNFFDTQSGMFFYTAVQQKDVMVRKMELNDGVIPASNSVMAKNLFVLGKILYQKDFEKKTSQMIHNMYNDIVEKPYYYSNWGIVLLQQIYQPFEIAITGKKALENRLLFSDRYLPNVIFAGATEMSDIGMVKDRFVGDDKIYVCQNMVCKYPVNTIEEALEQIQ